LLVADDVCPAIAWLPRAATEILPNAVNSAELCAAQFAIAVELQARGWPNVAYFEVYPSGPERRCTAWLAMVDLEDGDEIRVTFETPFPVDAGDDRKAD
jgi:hypothetical protein